MSNYTNFLDDLPKRTLTLVERYYKTEKYNTPSYEVTLLLSLASPLIVSNTEIIKNGFQNEDLEIKKRFEDSLTTVIKDLDSKSIKLLNGISHNWMVGKIENDDIPFEDIETRHFINFKPLRQSDKKFLTVLKEIRNALSHVGVKYFTDSESNIEKIIFRSMINMNDSSGGFIYHVLPIDDFKIFVINWCNYLQKNRDKNILKIIWLNNENNEYYKTGTNY